MYLVLRGYLVLGDVPAGTVAAQEGDGGVPARGVPGPRGCTCRGVPGPGGCTWSRRVYLPMGVYLVLGGVPAQGGVNGPRGCTYPGAVPTRGVYLVPGGPAQVLLTVNKITDACENITLPQLRCGR